LSAKLEQLLTLLNDNVWHNVDEIAEKVQLPRDKLEQIIKLLTETDMIQHNPATNQIRLNQDWKTLIMNQKEQNLETPAQKLQEENTTAVGTIIIPPKQTLIIQCTRMTNLTDSSLELEIRADKRIREIAINKIQ